LPLTAFVVSLQFQKKRKKGSEFVPIRAVEIKDTILEVCHERGDEWGNAVQARILHVSDLHAADAVYHREFVVSSFVL